ncbi:MAG: hypothetical protein JW818_11965 [Pirellulales bacterium]|nr:hypothetical protein [Pirellulales bacterium]
MIATLLLCVALLPTGHLAQADAETAVDAGQDALGSSWSGYPWYDAKNDAVRRLDVEPPDQVTASSTNSTSSFGSSGGGSGLGTLLEWLMWGLLVLLLAGLIFLLVRAYWQNRGGFNSTINQPTKDEVLADQRRIASLPFPIEAARSDLLTEARRHYNEGRYGEAAKYLFSYQLVQLDKHQLIRLTRGKTNRQYLREVGARGILAGMIEPVMIVFEEFFFGNHPIGRARFEACWSRLPEFEAQLAGRRS